ncbi:UNVERIFIED_CONTAM: Dolichyl-diphosphooligosaccharide--protein glycosyltransferase subunit [Sesamum latifolium]|uniref:Dolichyl-diphosphooligosaccharide--protein glycosyltransferase 48 kDa subunit n=1 Tax=Sesamum latifolium TaxID=2727402 RepID=A0AAW2Y8I1_9LAMI
MAGLKSPTIYFFLLNLISLLPLLAFSFSPDHPTARRILVLLDDLSLKSSHSLFFSSLQSRGFDLDFKLASDPAIAVKRYGEYLYDGLILFSPSTEHFCRVWRVLGHGGVLEFVDSGHDLILAADSNASDLIRNIAAECGVDFDEARNNARIMISGSLEMFSNRLFRSGVQKSLSSHKYGKSGNEQFITELSKWIFHERGHLKGLYHTSFKVPDVYGVFQFKVEYQRLGYTSLSLAKQFLYAY